MAAEAEGENVLTRLAALLADRMGRLPGLVRQLDGIDPASLATREALARVPVLRKPRLMEMQQEHPPFGGFVDVEALEGGRVFASPGPLWEGHGAGSDPFRGARALAAAGFERGDIVHNAFAYHMTPGGFILDEGARAMGCVVFPAGIGNTEQQVEAIAALAPCGYVGTPDYLKALLDHAEEAGKDASSIVKALVSGGALFPSLREAYARRGIRVMQCYATADVGLIAYETRAGEEVGEGMLVDEGVLVEIVRPGTDEPVPEGDVGEVVVTKPDDAYPLVRLGTGDLSAFLPGGKRLKGWMGRADQRTKVRGMFVDPAQVARVTKAHPEIARGRLVVTREGDTDAMTFEVEPRGPAALDEGRIAETLRAETKLRAEVRAVDAVANDGVVIDDRRTYDD